ncbi:unnamed protein product [Microthlaspi erraticum]|uniref:Uncharacterized protein n=1 Tax=Microthlaspi erraticum TaxID=1685480 RepID=A0A6D2J8X7_9BRAS|nr:unnamed protein product [Microthlaspi erraticum]
MDCCDETEEGRRFYIEFKTSHEYAGKEREVFIYYQKQERLLEGFTDMETIHKTGCSNTLESGSQLYSRFFHKHA